MFITDDFMARPCSLYPHPCAKNADVPKVAVNRAIMPACLPHKFVMLLPYSAIVDDDLSKLELFNINLRDVTPSLLNYFLLLL
jgi:hypothetical protein